MKALEQKYKISRKPLHGKQINGKLVRWRKANTSFSPSHKEEKQKEELQRTITLKINEQSISFIAKNQEGSFMSNGNDRSIDSFDKMIIGVEEVLDLDENTESQDPNYSLLYKQFQKLCKLELKSIESSSSDHSISAEQNKPVKEVSWQQQSQTNTAGKILKEKIQEVKQMLRQRGNSSQISLVSSDPNISIRLLGANLSQIHEEEIQHDSMHRMDPIEQQFIDFVSKGQGQNKINISKIQVQGAHKEGKKVAHKEGDPLKQAEEDEVVAMLENQLVSRVEPQEESINQQQPQIDKKRKKQSFLKDNFNQILSELDENEEKKLAASYAILAKRTEWVQSRTDKSQRWKERQLQMINQFRQILENPYAECSDDEEFSL